MKQRNGNTLQKAKLVNTYVNAGIAIGILIAGFLGGCTYKQRELNQIKADYAEQVNLGLQANRELEKKLQTAVNDVAVQYQQEKAASEKTIETLKRELANAKKSHPLPAVCNLDSERMRIIKAAVDNANHSRP